MRQTVVVIASKPIGMIILLLCLRSKQWVVKSKREDLLKKTAEYLHKNCRLCDRHFQPLMFMNPAKKEDGLVWNAVPTVFPQFQGISYVVFTSCTCATHLVLLSSLLISVLFSTVTVTSKRKAPKPRELPSERIETAVDPAQFKVRLISVYKLGKEKNMAHLDKNPFSRLSCRTTHTALRSRAPALHSLRHQTLMSAWLM